MTAQRATPVVTVLGESDVEIAGTVEGERALVEAEGFGRATGWTIEDRGLCRGDVCIPSGSAEIATEDGRIDLVTAAELMDRPIVVDGPTATVALGAPRADRTLALTDLMAPSFTLPDLQGTPQPFEQWHGEKRLLFAFASW